MADNDRLRREREAKAQAELEPVRRREMHAWLAQHPGRDEKDFLQLAWPHLKANLLEDKHQALYELARERMRRSGKYQM